MKNKLAENLLRFGIKNLNESEVEKLQGLIKEDSSSRQAFIAKLAKIDPKAADVVENKTVGVTISNKYVLNYVPTSEDGTGGAGTLYIYKVGASSGMPYIYLLGTADDRAGESSSPDDIYIESSKFDIKNYPGGYNEVWNSPNNRIFTQPVIEGALQFIGNNQEEFKKAFHRVSRSEYAIKNWWGDNSPSVRDSQYILWRAKYKNNALKAIKLVQDDELMYNIRFKVDNFRNNGEYPELTIPPSV